MNKAAIEQPAVEPIDAAVEEAIALCGGDPRAAVKALLVAYTDLEREMLAVSSSGFTRQWHRNRQSDRSRAG